MNLPTEAAASSQGGPTSESRAVRNPGGPMKPITMAAIAKAAGVSQGAISSLLNDRDYGIRVSEKTREKVFKVCRELGYVPNDLRAVVRMYPEQGDTCLLIPARSKCGVSNPFVARVANAALRASKVGNLAVAFYDEGAEYTNDGAELPPPLLNGTASRFLCLGLANASLCRIAHRRGHPFIYVGHEVLLPGATSILPDYAAAVRLALQHVANLGHKSIAIVGGPFGSPEPRLGELNKAIGVAAQQLGLLIDAQNIFQGDLTFCAGVDAMDALAARSPRPSAVFCLSEQSACGLLARALQKGLSVPKDLSVIALSDHSETPASCIGMTTVALPLEEMTVAAVAEAGRQLQAGVPTQPHRIVLGVKLCERESCAQSN